MATFKYKKCNKYMIDMLIVYIIDVDYTTEIVNPGNYFTPKSESWPRTCYRDKSEMIGIDYCENCHHHIERHTASKMFNSFICSNGNIIHSKLPVHSFDLRSYYYSIPFTNFQINSHDEISSLRIKLNYYIKMHQFKDVGLFKRVPICLLEIVSTFLI